MVNLGIDHIRKLEIMKPISETRRANLIYLRDTMFNGSQRKLANALDKQPSIITRTLNTSASGARGIGNSFASGKPDSFRASAEMSSNSKDMIAFVLNLGQHHAFGVPVKKREIDAG